MQLLNLSIDRIIIHQIYQRDQSDQIIPPTQGNEYTRFEPTAMGTFRKRVNQALGEKSKAVQMEIVHQGPNDLITLIDEMANMDDDAFKSSSFEIAKRLARAQNRANYPGGIVVVFSGTQGQYSKKILGIMKAEVHSGYEKIKDSISGEISLKFVEELLLTPGTKLYKTAGFFEKNEYEGTSDDLNDKWTVMVSDSQINKVNGKAAAQYFYEGFLGFGYRQTSARTTKQFYDAAYSFIDGLDISAEKKNEYLNALTIYLKVDMSSTISTSDFGGKYFDVDRQDLFAEYMEDEGIPTTSFTKDTEYITTNLKLRKIKFSSNVKITASPEAFRDLITIETIDGDPDESDTPMEWTQIIVKDRITQQG